MTLSGCSNNYPVRRVSMKSRQLIRSNPNHTVHRNLYQTFFK